MAHIEENMKYRRSHQQQSAPGTDDGSPMGAKTFGYAQKTFLTTLTLVIKGSARRAASSIHRRRTVKYPTMRHQRVSTLMCAIHCLRDLVINAEHQTSVSYFPFLQPLGISSVLLVVLFVAASLYRWLQVPYSRRLWPEVSQRVMP